jgi:ligand-binding SRPBCC domain-containing protein
MPIIHLTTLIHAPPQRVFDLSRSTKLHVASMKHTNEKVVACTSDGLLKTGDMVTWQAYHLFKTRTLQVTITNMLPCSFFCDEMIKGDFAAMKHEHHFKAVDNGTVMIDLFSFETPLGVAGQLFNKLYLTRYLHNLLSTRNSFIKQCAESDEWKTVLK